MVLATLFLKLNADRITRASYGYTIEGEIYSDRRKTIPYNLDSIDEIRFLIFADGDNVNILNVPVIKGQGEGNEHKFSYIVRRGDIGFEGIFKCNATLIADGISVATIPEEIFIEQSGSQVVVDV